MFNALVVEKDAESGKTSAAVKELSLDDLPEGEVTEREAARTEQQELGWVLRANSSKRSTTLKHNPP